MSQIANTQKKTDTAAKIVSLADLAREAARGQSLKIPEITENEVGDMLAAICAPTTSRVAV